jgi:hypothetical protein
VKVAHHPRIGDPAAQKVGEQPVQSVPPTGRADGVHEQVRCGEVGERRGAAAAAGQGVGEVGGHGVQDADPHQEVEQLRGQAVDHFIQQVRGHGVVVAEHVGARPIMPLPGVGLGLPDPVPQGLRVHVELLTQPPERRPRLGLPIQPNRPLAQLVGVLPRCWQQSLPPWSSRSN